MTGNNPHEHSVVPFNPYNSLVAVCEDRETEAQAGAKGRDFNSDLPTQLASLLTEHVRIPRGKGFKLLSASLFVCPAYYPDTRSEGYFTFLLGIQSHKTGQMSF